MSAEYSDKACSRSLSLYLYLNFTPFCRDEFSYDLSFFLAKNIFSVSLFDLAVPQVFITIMYLVIVISFLRHLLSDYYHQGSLNANVKCKVYFVTHTREHCSITVRLVSSLGSVALMHTNNNIFSCFVESNAVKPKTSCTVIFSLTTK